MLESASRVVIASHANADGDAAGSGAALGHWLEGRDVGATLVNPTPYPDQFRFLLDGLADATPSDPMAEEAVEAADLAVVLDTTEEKRLTGVWDLFQARDDLPVAVVDHHPPSPEAIGDPAWRDPSAAATAAMLYELLVADPDGTLPEDPAEALSLPVARGLYVGIVTDTGSFRFANATPSAHRITARLIEAGVDPQEMYRRLYARMTMARARLLQRALGNLHRDPNLPLAWMTIREEDVRRTSADREDREGLIEFARRLEGVEVALLFREMPDGRTKVSFRSNGPVNVSRLAARFGGGGHAKASGAVVELPPEAAIGAVIAEARSALRSHRGA